jgi:hypothetical protein
MTNISLIWRRKWQLSSPAAKTPLIRDKNDLLDVTSLKIALVSSRPGVILACPLCEIVEHGPADNRINSGEHHPGMTRRAITKDITLCEPRNKQMRAEHLWAANKQGTLN